jgi:hypothetical protein
VHKIRLAHDAVSVQTWAQIVLKQSQPRRFKPNNNALSLWFRAGEEISDGLYSLASEKSKHKHKVQLISCWYMYLEIIKSHFR